MGKFLWALLSVLFIFFGLLSTGTQPLFGVLTAAIGLLSFPNILSYFKIKDHKLALCVLAMIWVGSVFLFANQESQKRKEVFLTQKNEIIKSIQSSIDAGNYDEAGRKIFPYIDYKDQDINKLAQMVGNKLAEIKISQDAKNAEILKQKEADENKKSAEIKQRKKDEFMKLVSGKIDFESKMKLYEKMVTEFPDDQEISNEYARLLKISTQFSAWDGSHKRLVEIVKDNMNDPDSFSHADTVFFDKGSRVLVKMTFRGSNAFGGIVKSMASANFDLNGELIGEVRYQ